LAATGTAVSQKIEEAGVVGKVTSFVSTAADKTVDIGKSIYTTSTEKI
jgi:hypothetical protein